MQTYCALQIRSYCIIGSGFYLVLFVVYHVGISRTNYIRSGGEADQENPSNGLPWSAHQSRWYTSSSADLGAPLTRALSDLRIPSAMRLTTSQASVFLPFLTSSHTSSSNSSLRHCLIMSVAYSSGSTGSPYSSVSPMPLSASPSTYSADSVRSAMAPARVPDIPSPTSPKALATDAAPNMSARLMMTDSSVSRSEDLTASSSSRRLIVPFIRSPPPPARRPADT